MAFVLGLDLGVRSVGWALLEKQEDNWQRIVRAGVRVFEAGTEGDIDAGREESRGANRRLKRGVRRQIRRRRQRARALYRELAQAGFLPRIDAAPGRPMALCIQQQINDLDSQLRAIHAGAPSVQQLPYFLRARALDQRLEPFELGRALYHIGQRRGFKSNRKAEVKKTSAQDDAKTQEETRSRVYQGIESLRTAMHESGARTLGEYLSRLDPAEERIRNRYTHRSMYEEEFERIWEAQRPHHPNLTQELKDRIWEILFRQRPLRDTEDLIGECEWIAGEKRAAVWSLDYQRFRLLQAVNHLRITENRSSPRPLTEAERTQLVEALEGKSRLSVAEAKKILRLRKAEFTLEEGGEKYIPGNVVGARLAELLGEQWIQLQQEHRQRLVECIASAEDDEQLEFLLHQEWRFNEETARRIVREVVLPSGYCSLSLRAIQAVLPFLEQGLSVQEARQRAGIALERQVDVHAVLPPLAEGGVTVYNPAAKRALTEMRKVVNAVIRRYGKPDEIHIETARELRKSREERMKDAKRMRGREAERESMRKRIHDQVGLPLDAISREDILKGLLWDECKGICPYCGNSLGGFATLFGDTSQAQIEHIIPFSRSLDNSFVNLTLAHVRCNREKGDRTPWGAFGADPERWEQILQRADTLDSSLARAKRNRFRMREEAVQDLLEQFSSRHLNDTRTIAVAAARYLALLYGGEIVDGRRKILKPTGQITAYLRDVWNLNGLIPSLHRENGGGEAEEESARIRKNRSDHRHHAIDAVVTALCDLRWINTLSEANRGAVAARRRLFAPVPPPWAGFKEELRECLKSMNVSFRPDHRVTGALHKETFYTRVGETRTRGDIVRVRKPVSSLSEGDIDCIADLKVREIVRAKFMEAGRKAQNLERNWPMLPNRNGDPVPIKKVRLELNRSVVSVGRDPYRRYAEPSETHHIEIYEVTRNGTTIWSGKVVSMRDAAARVASGEPVVDRREMPGARLLFTLSKEDTVRLSGDRQGIWVVKKIMSSTQVMLVPQHDARKANGQADRRSEFSPRARGLQEYHAEKVVVLPIGDVVPCHE